MDSDDDLNSHEPVDSANHIDCDSLMDSDDDVNSHEPVDNANHIDCDSLMDSDDDVNSHEPVDNANRIYGDSLVHCNDDVNSYLPVDSASYVEDESSIDSNVHEEDSESYIDSNTAGSDSARKVLAGGKTNNDHKDTPIFAPGKSACTTNIVFEHEHIKFREVSILALEWSRGLRDLRGLLSSTASKLAKLNANVAKLKSEQQICEATRAKCRTKIEEWVSAFEITHGHIPSVANKSAIRELYIQYQQQRKHFSLLDDEIKPIAEKIDSLHSEDQKVRFILQCLDSPAAAHYASVHVAKTNFFGAVLWRAELKKLLERKQAIFIELEKLTSSRNSNDLTNGIKEFEAKRMATKAFIKNWTAEFTASQGYPPSITEKSTIRENFAEYKLLANECKRLTEKKKGLDKKIENLKLKEKGLHENIERITTITPYSSNGIEVEENENWITFDEVNRSSSGEELANVNIDEEWLHSVILLAEEVVKTRWELETISGGAEELQLQLQQEDLMRRATLQEKSLRKVIEDGFCSERISPVVSIKTVVNYLPAREKAFVSRNNNERRDSVVREESISSLSSTDENSTDIFDENDGSKNKSVINSKLTDGSSADLLLFTEKSCSSSNSEEEKSSIATTDDERDLSRPLKTDKNGVLDSVASVGESSSVPRFVPARGSFDRPDRAPFSTESDISCHGNYEQQQQQQLAAVSIAPPSLEANSSISSTSTVDIPSSDPPLNIRLREIFMLPVDVRHSSSIDVLDAGTRAPAKDIPADTNRNTATVSRSSSSTQEKEDTTTNVHSHNLYNTDHYMLCAVCLENPANYLVVPCGHHCGCGPCLQKVCTTTRQCPICRKKITSNPIKVFRAGVQQQGGDLSPPVPNTPTAHDPATIFQPDSLWWKNYALFLQQQNDDIEVDWVLSEEGIPPHPEEEEEVVAQQQQQQQELRVQRPVLLTDNEANAIAADTEQSPQAITTVLHNVSLDSDL